MSAQPTTRGHSAHSIARQPAMPAPSHRWRLKTPGWMARPAGSCPVGMLESILAVALAWLACLLVSSLPHAPWGLLQLQPHPLWLIVLALAIRYGVPSGEIAAVLAAGGYVLLEVLNPSAHRLGADAFYAPFMLLLTGMVTAELTQTRLSRLATAERTQQDLRRKLHDLHQRYAALLEVKTELEKRIVGQPASLTMLYQLAKRLDTLDPEQLSSAVLDMIATYLEAKACAVYIWQDGQLRLRTGLPRGFPAREETLDPTNPLIAETLRTRRVTTIRDILGRLEAESPTRYPVLMAGPLLRANGQIYGVVVVERLAFLKLSPANRRLFELILDWGSHSLERAMLFQQSNAIQAPYQAFAPTAPSRRSISRSGARSTNGSPRHQSTRPSRSWEQERAGARPHKRSAMATTGSPAAARESGHAAAV